MELENEFKRIKTLLKEELSRREIDLIDWIEAADRAAYSIQNVWRERKNEKKVTAIDAIHLASHLCIHHGIYSHHGLYKGEREVIHYSKGEVQIIGLEDFLQDYDWEVIDSPIKYDEEKIVERALSRLGEREYNVILNNCEHFVIWCRSGTEESLYI